MHSPDVSAAHATLPLLCCHLPIASAVLSVWAAVGEARRLGERFEYRQCVTVLRIGRQNSPGDLQGLAVTCSDCPGNSDSRAECRCSAGEGETKSESKRGAGVRMSVRVRVRVRVYA